MKMKTILISLFATLFLLAGCKTTEVREPQPISWRQQQDYSKKVRDPRIFGLGIYDTPTGPQIRGGGRVHPGQIEMLEMLTEEEETLRPVVNLHGNFGVQWPVLLDVTMASSWFEFDTAQAVGARPVSEGSKVQLIHLPGEEISACFSLIPSVRLGQLFIENALVYVRLANGPLGSVARDIVEPEIKGVVGWDLLQNLEQIQFLYSIGQIVLVTSEAYEPNPNLLVAQLPLVERAGACVVRGTVDGQSGVILIDPSGDFEVATGSGRAVSLVQLGTNLTFSNPQVSRSTGGVRMGAQLLKNYQVTICPLAGLVYFETQPVEEE